jgi:uncharacterized protein YndB with AHSA1/START domain
MTERTVSHGMFTLERTYPASSERVFAAFATAEGKARWFVGPSDDWTLVERAFDFREGGEERLTGRWANGMLTEFHARYLDIVEGARIVYVYEMRQNGTKISASLATLEFRAATGGTRLVVTEQGAFLDGYEDAGARERGAALLLDQVGRSL